MRWLKTTTLALALAALAIGVEGASPISTDTDWKCLEDCLQCARADGATAHELRLKCLDLRWKIAEQGGIPQWDGEQLLDVADSVCGAEPLDPESRALLAKLNYWEQAYGETSVSPEWRDRRFSLGEERAAIEGYVRQLRERGIRVALDCDEGLWKVVAGDESGKLQK
jgi:hypothetical protein